MQKEQSSDTSESNFLSKLFADVISILKENTVKGVNNPTDADSVINDFFMIQSDDKNSVMVDQVPGQHESDELTESPCSDSESSKSSKQQSVDKISNESEDISYSSDSSYEEDNRHLLDAVRDNDLDTVKKLTLDGANLNYKDEEGNTALLLATRDGQYKIVKYLINHGADINAINKGGSSVVTHVKQNDYFKIMSLLRSHGVSIDTPSYPASEILLRYNNLRTEYYKCDDNSAPIVKMWTFFSLTSGHDVKPSLSVDIHDLEKDEGSINRNTI